MLIKAQSIGRDTCGNSWEGDTVYYIEHDNIEEVKALFKEPWWEVTEIQKLDLKWATMIINQDKITTFELMRFDNANR